MYLAIIVHFVGCFILIILRDINSKNNASLAKGRRRIQPDEINESKKDRQTRIPVSGTLIVGVDGYVLE